LACNDYDVDIGILDTSNPNVDLHFRRKVTPGLLKFFDIKLQGDLLKVLSLRDEEFFVDIINMKTKEVSGEKQ
jgi:hypothetical protein